ncbi:putative helicase mov-10-B.2 [Contarinia nasturtii]|uniref:putative helicase mov-10-B.2 n=1 Tax=Contarinia nasturtii TaxID=265458 RepID=UPI0012D389CB|nr:putative helicase mov-10-B.2 [Contarinia nasturtii]
MAPKDIADWYIGSDLLPSREFPIIFRSVQGVCTKLDQDFSMYKMNVVIDFIKNLLNNVIKNGRTVMQTDIGVVSPYKLQCKEIMRACHHNNLRHITIGSAEIFQGQEKPVIIISTV